MQGGKTAEFRRLRTGYTTGSCAAAAAKAAALLLLTGEACGRVEIRTPKNILLTLPVEQAQLSGSAARCAVVKDSGDDPDITNGILVCATVEKSAKGIMIDGGEGVGRVTRAGLDQPVGAAAINSVPRAMIAQACQEAAKTVAYDGGFRVVISIPQGSELAKKTFNPRLGIEGGLSVIGTSGIVEPMSTAALVDTLCLEINVLAEGGKKSLLLSPGSYGETFAQQTLELDTSEQVLCSNYIGEALKAAAEKGFERILLVGHIGKLVKLGIGITNTHSDQGDGRMETLIACALEAGAPITCLLKLLSCATTDAAVELLHAAGWLKPSMNVLSRRVEATLLSRVPERVETGFICFSHAASCRGIIAKSENADRLARCWRRKEGNSHL